MTPTNYCIGFPPNSALLAIKLVRPPSSTLTMRLLLRCQLASPSSSSGRQSHGQHPKQCHLQPHPPTCIRTLTLHELLATFCPIQPAISRLTISCIAVSGHPIPGNFALVDLFHICHPHRHHLRVTCLFGTGAVEFTPGTQLHGRDQLPAFQCRRIIKQQTSIIIMPGL